MNANESNLYCGFFFPALFFYRQITCDALSHLTFWSTNWQEATCITSWDVMMSKLEDRERQGTCSKKKEEKKT